MANIWRRWSTLCRWLGPWADEERSPRVKRDTIDVAASDSRSRFPMRIYGPRMGQPSGSILLIPGLHFEGPDHLRMDRFAAILAQTGTLVFAPFVPSLLAMRFQEDMIEDVERAFRTMLKHPGRPSGPPGLVRISFGSLPALRLAAHPDLGPEIKGLMTFGGFIDWRRTLEFCIHGDPHVPHDPLNRPVVFSNLLEHLPQVPNPSAVDAAWLAYMNQTWGQMDLMENEDERRKVADSLGAQLDEQSRRLFLQGCALAPGGPEILYRALSEANEKHWLNPLPHPKRVYPPLWAVHGVDDNVIPYTQSQMLSDAYTGAPSTCLLTGLFGHSGQGHKLGLGRLKTAWNELMSLMRILRVLVILSQGDSSKR